MFITILRIIWFIIQFFSIIALIAWIIIFVMLKSGYTLTGEWIEDDDEPEKDEKK